MTIVVHEDRETEIAEARVAGEELWLSRADVERATGWHLSPEGLCRGTLCLPVPRGREAEFVRGDTVDIAAFWRHAGQPVVHDDTGAAWVLGTGAGQRGQALRSLEAPDFTLPDLDGRTHALSDHRGRKVLLVTWASW
jgi:AhpC/TSA family